MKLKDLLSPEYQRKYDEACRDWKAGRNLCEAASIVYGTTSERRIATLVKHRETELASKRKRGNKLRIKDLGLLTLDGEDYVGKTRVLLYPKKLVQVAVPLEIAEVGTIENLWKRFRTREKTLLRELQSAVGKHYRFVINRPGVEVADHRPAMRSNADIWMSLEEPELAFLKRGKRVELLVGWTPPWEEEHGVYAFLNSDLAITKVGEYG